VYFTCFLDRSLEGETQSSPKKALVTYPEMFEAPKALLLDGTEGLQIVLQTPKEYSQEVTAMFHLRNSEVTSVQRPDNLSQWPKSRL
jgi:hypothetical protein